MTTRRRRTPGLSAYVEGGPGGHATRGPIDTRKEELDLIDRRIAAGPLSPLNINVAKRQADDSGEPHAILENGWVINDSNIPEVPRLAYVYPGGRVVLTDLGKLKAKAAAILAYPKKRAKVERAVAESKQAPGVLYKSPGRMSRVVPKSERYTMTQVLKVAKIGLPSRKWRTGDDVALGITNNKAAPGALDVVAYAALRLSRSGRFPGAVPRDVKDAAKMIAKIATIVGHASIDDASEAIRIYHGRT